MYKSSSLIFTGNNNSYSLMPSHQLKSVDSWFLSFDKIMNRKCSLVEGYILVIYCGTYIVGTTQAMQICYHLIDGVYRGIDINQIKVLKPIKLHELLQQWNKPLFTPEVEVYLKWIALCLNNGCHPPNTQRHLLVVPGTYFLYSNTPLMWRTRVP